jgi:hypothetical protein
MSHHQKIMWLIQFMEITNILNVIAGDACSEQ